MSPLLRAVAEVALTVAAFVLISALLGEVDLVTVLVFTVVMAGIVAFSTRRRASA